MRLRHKEKKVMALILAPLSFLIVGYGLIFALIQPTIRPLFSIYNLIASEYGPNFDSNSKNLLEIGKTSGGNISIKDFVRPDVGDQYGQITIDAVGLKVNLYYGDSNDVLELGAGQFQGSFMPGFNRAILIAGHTIPYFQKFGDLKTGDTVEILTYYGTFKYKITDLKIGNFNDDSLYDLAQREKEQLIMYTCYPLDGIGFKTERLFVYADKISGPTVEGA